MRRDLGFYGYVQFVCPQLVAVLTSNAPTYYAKLLRFVVNGFSLGIG